MKSGVRHTPVLLKEVIEGLALREGDIVVDATFGDGGHAREICKKIGTSGALIGLDLDEEAIQQGGAITKECAARIFLEKENFKNMDRVTSLHGFTHVNKIVFDLGLRSHEIEESGRGFSFRKDEPLLMTFEAHPREETLTARDIVNFWNEEDLARAILMYGEERYARRVARTIVAERKKRTIEKTGDLVAILEKSIPFRYQHRRLHFAAKTFQALRIIVNDELGNLTIALKKAGEILTPGGRIAVISFHSLEDRIVKRFFLELKNQGNFIRITKKPIIQSSEEREKNPRGRSAKLRIIQKM